MKKTQFKDKMLATLPTNSDLFKGDSEELIHNMYETVVRVSGLTNPYEQYDLEEIPEFTQEVYGSGPMMQQLLKILIQLSGAKRVLELGSFIGVTTIAMAEALPDDGEVVALEKFDYFASIAQKNFIRNGVSSKIKLIEGDAFESLKKLDKDAYFDFIFLDGNKEKYADYFQMIDPLLSPGGIFIVDDSLFNGDVLNDKCQTEKGSGVFKFLKKMETEEGYMKLLLPISNGVTIMVKKLK